MNKKIRVIFSSLQQKSAAVNAAVGVSSGTEKTVSGRSLFFLRSCGDSPTGTPSIEGYKGRLLMIYWIYLMIQLTYLFSIQKRCFTLKGLINGI